MRVVRDELPGALDLYRSDTPYEVQECPCMRSGRIVKVQTIPLRFDLSGMFVGIMAKHELLEEEKCALMIHLLTKLHLSGPSHIGHILSTGITS